MNQDISFIYLGGEPLGVPVLERLLKAGFKPKFVVSNPDKPSGRGKKITSPPVKELATLNNIPTLQPKTQLELIQVLKANQASDCDVFIVVAYNKILTKEVLDLPKSGVLNLHPSLLPKLRGPSPVRTAILNNEIENLGVSIIKLDEEMDHGPIVKQSAYSLDKNSWPINGDELEVELAYLGADLLIESITPFINGEIKLKEQDHNQATYTKKLNKSDGQLEIDPYDLPTGIKAKEILFKIKAYSKWPGTYFFFNGKRIKILEAHLDKDNLVIDKIIPEGKSAINFSDYFKA